MLALISGNSYFFHASLIKFHYQLFFPCRRQKIKAYQPPMIILKMNTWNLRWPTPNKFSTSPYYEFITKLVPKILVLTWNEWWWWWMTGSTKTSFVVIFVLKVLTFVMLCKWLCIWWIYKNYLDTYLFGTELKKQL